jgi:hypothetical protein
MTNDPTPFEDADLSLLEPLSPDDAAALDAYMSENGRSSTANAQRVEAVEDLIGLLGVRAPLPTDPSLIDATLARVARARRLGAAEAVLAEADAAAVDALVDVGMNPAALPAAHARRGTAAAALLATLDHHAQPAAASRAALIAATMAKVDAAESTRRDRYRLVPELPTFRRRMQVGDVVGVAAALLLGVSVLWPMLSEFREQGRRAACASNLAGVGSAFGMYAGDYRDSLPLASPSRGGDPWWDIGKLPERSNAANLFTLVRTGYSGLEPLACAASPGSCRTPDAVAKSGMDWRSSDDVSYSFQILFGRASQARMSQSPAAVLLTDRSPVVVRALRSQPIDPFGNSLNHAESGQNILTADRAVQWTRSPVLPSGDNIYLPRSVEDLINRSHSPTAAEPIRGTETPEYQDVFVGP